MPSYQVICAEVLAWAKEYKERIERGEAEPFHALCCDPPWEYHFMSRSWDQTGITFQPETWSTLAAILHPGAFLFVFAGSRGWHRLACAMEDAGLILQPSIFVWGLGVVEVPFCLGWLQAQAFPKATRIDTQIDKGCGESGRWKKRLDGQPRGGGNLIGQHVPTDGQYDYISATPLARAWEGHRYGGQVLKDALTPIIVAQKPWDGKRLDCIVRTGAGSLNVDAGRVAASDQDILDAAVERMRGNEAIGWKNTSTAGIQPVAAQGRWPSNFVLVHRAPGPDGEGGCVRAGTKRVKPLEGHRPNPVAHQADGRIVFNEKPPGYQKTSYTDPDGFEHVDAWRCAEGCVVARLGEMSGESKSRAGPPSPEPTEADSQIYGFATYPEMHKSGAHYGDKGTAARFYHQAGWEHERAEMECARDPETGEPLCPVAKLDEQAGERKSGGSQKIRQSGESAWFTSVDGAPLAREFSDSGGASRFYHNADWSAEIAERLATEAPVRYNPKAAKKERNSGLDDFYWKKDKASPTGFVRVGREEWEALGEEEQRVKAETGKRVSLRARGNIHPTVKPLSLTKWLADLLSPPKEYAPRRLLVPFAGVASEMCGAILSGGFEEVIGVEMIPDYVAIAEARAAFWAGPLFAT